MMREPVQNIDRAMLEEVLQGLRAPQKSLPSKYFYDERGSELFEEITHEPEYYPTRTEHSIMEDHIDEIVEAIGQDLVLIEPGSGSSKKTRILLDHLPDLKAYVPVEISQKYLSKVVEELREEYPSLRIRPVCADYTRPFQLPDIDTSFEYYVVFYPGSTIGNFYPEEARDFLKLLAGFMVPGGGLLIGVDLKKDPAILEAAYNDRNGTTAAFNKNLLVHLNRVLGADFKTDKFKHEAIYNAQKGRIEMHLISKADQTVHVNGRTIHFKQGEIIHTENSYKYSPDDFKDLVHDWFQVKRVWADEQNLFSVQYLVKK